MHTENHPHDPIRRVALVTDPDAAGDEAWHLVTALLEQDIPGYTLEPLSDAHDRFGRLWELESGRYDLVHILGPGRASVAALAAARTHELPVATSYHRQIRSATFYLHGRTVLSPSSDADLALADMQVPLGRVARWRPAVDREHFGPAHYCRDLLPGAFNLLLVGPLDRSRRIELLAEAALTAVRRDPRLHLVMIGSGPGEARLRGLLGSVATFLGAVDRELLAQVYASADLLVHPGEGAFYPAVSEAQASGLPVLAVESAGIGALIENGRSGCLVDGDPAALAAAITGLARRSVMLDRLATGGLAAARRRSSTESAAQLTAGYARALAPADAEPATPQVPAQAA